MNIVFLGTPNFAKDILALLACNHNILATITQPDKPYGRKRILTPPPVKTWSIDNNTPCFQPQKSSEILAILDSIQESNNIDVIIVIAYGKILKDEVISKYKCLNLHGSILPYFRGASPIQTSIMNDYAHFGLTVIDMDSGLDSGDILGICEIDKSVVENQTLDCVFKILVPYSINLLESVLHNLSNNTLKPIPQDEKEATFCKKLEKEDAHLDFANAKNCFLKYLALHSIGVWMQCGDKVIKINELSGYESNIYDTKGKILNIKNDEVLIACESGALWLHYVTMPNKPLISAKAMLQSLKLNVGDIIDIS